MEKNVHPDDDCEGILKDRDILEDDDACDDEDKRETASASRS